MTAVGDEGVDHLVPMTFAVTRWLKPAGGQDETVTVRAPAPADLGFEVEETNLVTSYQRGDVAASVEPLRRLSTYDRQLRLADLAKSVSVACPRAWLDADFEKRDVRDDT